MIMKIKYRHSASKTNTFIDSPAFWIINELYDFDSGPNARMVMGLAAEDAANHALQNQITDENTITEFAQKKYLEHDGINGDEDECDWSAIIANKFVQELPQFGDVVSWQNELQVPGKKWGLEHDIICKTDFEFKDVIVDTKATAYIKRLKSGKVDARWYPKPADIRQQCLYREVFGKETMLLYCSPTDQYCVDMVGRDELKPMINAMKHIEHILKIAPTKEDSINTYAKTRENNKSDK